MQSVGVRVPPLVVVTEAFALMAQASTAWHSAVNNAPSSPRFHELVARAWAGPPPARASVEVLVDCRERAINLGEARVQVFSAVHARAQQLPGLRGKVCCKIVSGTEGQIQRLQAYGAYAEYLNMPSNSAYADFLGSRTALSPRRT